MQEMMLLMLKHDSSFELLGYLKVNIVLAAGYGPYSSQMTRKS